MQHAVIITHV
jgi:hypothetical protein